MNSKPEKIKSKYKHVYWTEQNRRAKSNGKSLERIASWCVHLNKKGMKISNKRYTTEKEAALAVDMMYIKHGFEPVNILKRKTV